MIRGFLLHGLHHGPPDLIDSRQDGCRIACHGNTWLSWEQVDGFEEAAVAPSPGFRNWVASRYRDEAEAKLLEAAVDVNFHIISPMSCGSVTLPPIPIYGGCNFMSRKVRSSIETRLLGLSGPPVTSGFAAGSTWATMGRKGATCA